MNGQEELIKEEGEGERGGEDMQWLFVHEKGEGGNLVQICRKYRPARPLLAKIFFTVTNTNPDQNGETFRTKSVETEKMFRSGSMTTQLTRSTLEF